MMPAAMLYSLLRGTWWRMHGAAGAAWWCVGVMLHVVMAEQHVVNQLIAGTYKV